MAYEGWLEYNGVEIANVARTALLARSMGLGLVRIKRNKIEWLSAAFGGDIGGFGIGPFGETPFGIKTYEDIGAAPWYDEDHEPSKEFAGVIPLSVMGLDESTLSRTPTEYITDGGNNGRARNATLPLVANFVVVASTERGAEFGLKWLTRILRSGGEQGVCSGTTLRYFQYGSPGSPIVHRRDVSMSRAPSVTRKTNRKCSATWMVTFTLTAADPYEYGEAMPTLFGLGSNSEFPTGSVVSSGSLIDTEVGCPVYDYTPIFDPLYPALIPSPTAPDFLPTGWNIEPGMEYKRFYAYVDAPEPSILNLVPLIELRCSVDARRVRVSVWPAGSATDIQCGPLFSAVVNYLPANLPMYLDGEQTASYCWDGVSPAVRRTDSLVFAPDANPVQWTSFNDDQLLVTLDAFEVSDGVYEGLGNLRVDLSLVPKSD